VAFCALSYLRDLDSEGDKIIGLGQGVGLAFRPGL